MIGRLPWNVTVAADQLRELCADDRVMQGRIMSEVCGDLLEAMARVFAAFGPAGLALP
jgi:hypothetical protein